MISNKSYLINLDDFSNFTLGTLSSEREYKFRLQTHWLSKAVLDSNLYPILFHHVNLYSTSIIWDFGEEVGIALVIQEKNTIRCSIAGLTNADVLAIRGILEKIFPVAEPPEQSLNIKFWFHTPNGPHSIVRELDAPSWEEIGTNYPDKVLPQIEDLMQLNADNIKPAGKLILWTGPPGTGKSFCIRALARKWRPWCGISYICDPENFLGDASYLLKVVLEDDMIGDSEYKLLILEDSGELLGKDAKGRIGQGLSRLLNICDGLIGQGIKLMVLITTNEDMEALHDALIRPGRCMSNIYFPAFTKADATQWLLAHNHEGAALDNKAHTLAQLYATLNGYKDIARLKQKVGVV